MDPFLTALPVAISIAALAISVAAFVINQRRDRRDLFLKMHERLIEPDLQEGRRLLYRVNSVADVAGLPPEEYALVNRAVAMLDVFGMYVVRGFIDKDVALEEWGHVYAKAAAHGRHVVEYRAGLAGGTWPQLPNVERFGRLAAAWAEESLRSGEDLELPRLDSNQQPSD